MPSLSDGFERKFELDPSILPAGAASSVTINLTTDADVALALAQNKPFPVRPSGVIPLSGIAFAANAGQDLKLTAGKTTVGFEFSAAISSGIGIYDDAPAALKALNLPETPGIRFDVADDASTRLAMIKLHYEAEGKVSGTHPIGTIGSFTFGAQAGSSGLFAILRRFPADSGALTVMKDTVASFRLPRHVGLKAGDVNIAPGCWVIAEVEGNAALKVGTQLGYHFSFVHEAKLGDLTGDIGLKIDAGLRATFGFEVSGKFLAVVGRERDDSRVRLQLFKQTTHGMNFGLNLKVGVTSTVDIPEDADDFIQAVFGVHGAQIAKSLRRLDEWTDKSKSPAELVAGLANSQALELIKNVTGIDPATRFDQAKGKLLGALGQWDALPGKVSSRLWKLLNEGDLGLNKFVATLEVLADPVKTKAKLQELIASTGLTDKIEGQWLNSLIDGGTLALVNQLDLVRDAAAKTLGALQADVLRKLKQQLDAKLHLDQIRDAVTTADFKKIDGFLVGRLSLFLEKELDFQSLNDIKNAINTIAAKRQEIFAKARKALNSTYSFELAAAYKKVTTADALIDAEFDLSKPKALELFTAVMQDAALDRLLVEPTTGVKLNQAVMSHGITRTSFVQLSMPLFSFRSDHKNTSLAKVRAQDLKVVEEGGRVLVYDVSASDEVTVRNQFRSRLSIALTANVSSGIRVDDSGDFKWSYRLLHAKKKMKREELEGFARPFIEEYLPQQFMSGTDLSTFFTMFDAAVEEKLKNGSNEFGDVLTSMEVSIPGSALGAWLLPMTKDQRQAAKMRVSRAIQAGLKRLLPFYYFQDIDRLQQNSAAAPLLVWASIRPSTSVDFRDGRLTFNQDREPYWNFPDVELRRVMASNPDTAARLGASLAQAKRRLQEAGRDNAASFFDAREARDFISLAVDNGRSQFNGLLFFEAEVVSKASEALDDLADLDSVMAKKPSEAIKRLAEFGSDITSAFNEKLSAIYADKSALRALGQVVFLEASQALNPSLSAVKPQAMITMTALAAGHNFDMSTFLEGELPAADLIAVEQLLLNA